MATKKYESMRIMSLEGSVLYKNEGFSATKNGKPDPQAFRGVLDESLDTLKLAEVYDQHKSEIGYPNSAITHVIWPNFSYSLIAFSFSSSVYLLPIFDLSGPTFRPHPQLFIQSRRGCSASNGQGVQLGRYIQAS